MYDAISEMRELIKYNFDKEQYDVAKECLSIYKSSVGEDNFYMEIERRIFCVTGPRVLIVCIECDANVIDNFLNSQTYKCIDTIVIENTNDLASDINECIRICSDEYMGFLLPDVKYSDDAIECLMKKIYDSPEANVVIGRRTIVSPKGEELSHFDVRYRNSFDNVYIDGAKLIDHCIEENINLWGTLGNIVVKPNRNTSLINYISGNDRLSRFAVILQLLDNKAIVFIRDTIATTIVRTEVGMHTEILAEQIDFLNMFCKNRSVKRIGCSKEVDHSIKKYPKSIKFFATDNAEKQNLAPIAVEARKRGYDVEETNDFTVQAEIGVYSQHIVRSDNSKFSITLIHDMFQACDRWPNIWEHEIWSQFDVGILPGNKWLDMWNESACCDCVNPRLGTFALGYPKGDIITNEEIIDRANIIRQQFDFKYDKTVLYAPSWENDDKEDDFVKALCDLPINLVIKQAHWIDFYREIQENVANMRKIHYGKYDNLYYMDPMENIMVALHLCDLIVSDESNVMAEAMLIDKPSIAVMDWLIPDENPHRLPHVPVDCVYKCKKSQLRNTVLKVLGYESENDNELISVMDTSQFASETYNNRGRAAKYIMDAIDYFTGNGDKDEFLQFAGKSKYDRILISD